MPRRPQNVPARNTPAYAGKTVQKELRESSVGKHPRLRGEDRPIVFHHCNITETPPLTRGRLKVYCREESSDGNTPAYAGKTNRAVLNGRDDEKHPRLRGEDCPQSATKSYELETPPLTRGRRDETISKLLPPGNTPAYAGKTGSCGFGDAVEEKHPRLRGEDSTYGLLNRPAGGNTPAYAGKTDRSDEGNRGLRKHPRLRGEDS